MSVEYLLYNGICSTQLIIEKFTQLAPEFTERLQSIWKDMGISPNSHRDRIDAVVNYIQELLSDMVADEENLLKELVENTEKYKGELSSLAEVLVLPPYEAKEDLPLIEREKDLRTKLDAWNLERHERVKKLKNLREKEAILSRRLDLPAHNTGVGEVPTELDIKEIEANIEYMKNELARAELKFQQARQAILKLWEGLEIDGTQSTFPDIANEKAEDAFVLSKENLQSLKEYLSKLEKQQERNHKESQELMKKLKNLWINLEIDEQEQSAFKERCIGFRPSSILKLKKEVAKYESMKLKYTEKFIIGLRKELTQLWNKCYVGDGQRTQFTPAFDDNYTEESLNLHEHQIHVLRGFYEENKDIFKLVEKREIMWGKLMEFENKENDPSRLFSNRGGALLKELKTKNAIQKGLPKVEEELRKAITTWEDENEDVFLINGERYLNLIQAQQENRKRVKKMLKLGKKKEKKEALIKDMKFGSKPAVTLNRTNSLRLCKTNNKYQNNGKQHHESKNGSSAILTDASSSNSNLPPASTKTKKKFKSARRISCKVRKRSTLALSPLRRRQDVKLEDMDDTYGEDDNDIDDSASSSIESSLCSYPDFTSHIRKRSERGLSSTAASVESFHSPSKDVSS